MTIELTKMTTPKGRPAVHMRSSGYMTGDDAAKVNTSLQPGAPFADLPIFAVVTEDAEFSVEARKGFASMGGANPENSDLPTAVVLRSTPQRMMISFIMKASDQLRGRKTPMKFFSNEAEALGWLDAELDRLPARPAR